MAAHSRTSWAPLAMLALVVAATAHAEEEDAGEEDEGEYPGDMGGEYGDMPGGGDYGDYGDMGDEGHGGGGGGSGPTLKKGVVHADAATLPLLIGARPVLVKCDKEYAYGDKETAFADFAKREAVLESDLLVVEIGVNEYATDEDAEAAETKALCASLGAKDDSSFPSFILFKKGAAAVNAGVKYDGDVEGDKLASFVTREAGVFLGPPGTLEVFDKLAAKFVREVGAQTEILAQAKKELAGLTRDRDRTYANFYISMMEKMKGPEEAAKCKACEQCFRHTEEERIRKLSQGGVTAEQRREFERRLNALPAFGGK